VTGFDIFDRYDLVTSVLFSAVLAGALVVGAPLWALVLILFVCALVGFIRHFDEIMGP
jgi:hypothetical protein